MKLTKNQKIIVILGVIVLAYWYIANNANVRVELTNAWYSNPIIIWINNLYGTGANTVDNWQYCDSQQTCPLGYVCQQIPCGMPHCIPITETVIPSMCG